ncbi:unnamed protein product [Oncorhynchus mykiss]|nr:unnamed protein product [Oncorhynchus mykiss]
MVIVGLSVIATVLVLQYHHHDPDGSKMPKWTRVILLNWCAWFLRMKRPGEDRVRPACHNKHPRGSLTSMDLNTSASAPHSTNGNMLYIGLESMHYTTAATSPDSGVLCGRLVCGRGEDEVLLPTRPTSSAGSLEPDLAKLLDEVRYIAKRFRDQDEDELVCNEWKFAASVIDRLCLMAFSLFTILCTIGILMSAPNFVEAISKDFFT